MITNNNVKSYRPYVSVDVETTGLAPESVLIEIGAVLEDWKTPIKDLKVYRGCIRYPFYTYAEPRALVINAKLIENIDNGNVQSFSPGQTAEMFLSWLETTAQPEIALYDEKNGLINSLKGKIQFAGKNPSFDVTKIGQFLAGINMGSDYFTKRFGKVKMHRTIDPGPLYLGDFGYIPSLPEINKLTDRGEVTHEATKDALDVVVAMRKKLGIPC